jgi:O-antigen/teichoic acid export membrane protein
MSGPALRSKAVHAVAWSLVESIFQVGIQFAVGVILARLLFPRQFGLIGMLAVITAIIRTFMDSGFGAALIQKREVDNVDLSSVFYFNVLVGIAAAAVLCLIAPMIAAFYGEPILTPVTRALSLTVVINAFGMIQRTILTRQISFRGQAVAALIGGSFSGATAIVLALLDYGVWSLVAQQVTASAATVACFWWFSSWRPKRLFSLQSIRGMFGFGSRILLSGVLNQFFDNLYYVVIGKLFTATDLGYFTRARTLSDLPAQTLGGMIGRVAFPVLSVMQDDPPRVRRALKTAVGFIGLSIFPAMIGLAVMAHSLVLMLLTEKWAPCVPYLQLLCLSAVLYPLHLVNVSLLQALGRSDLFFRLEVAKKGLIAASLAVTWWWGISAIIWGMIATSIIAYYLNTWYGRTLIGYSLWDQVLDLLPYLAASLVMAGVVYVVGVLQQDQGWLGLASQMAAGVATYLAVCHLCGLAAYLEVWRTARAWARQWAEGSRPEGPAT